MKKKIRGAAFRERAFRGFADDTCFNDSLCHKLLRDRLAQLSVSKIERFHFANMILLSYLIAFAVAMFIHELGHLFAAWASRVPVSELGLGWGRKLFGFKFGHVEYKLHALPVGAYVRLDMRELQTKPLSLQVFVLMAGIIVNLVAAFAAQGTIFGWMNLLLAVTNLLPVYQQDGWKCGMVMMRALMNRKSALAEWTFTIAGGALSLLLFVAHLT
ncbi:MAG: site-2 protease family protein [Pyrinomonadaceae bacterium]